jgi:UDP-N-acetylglucosamine diphosphorylase / glucose-1-phosphate thymidylyltransferase / UDP-N-acetylgalactosamine diphosphorylase / glucosamine-1-phosphate N-acetyltransferase / galactosamine-1-phosphate N-acetyltransferase
VTALLLYDDARARAFEPFALTRPVSAMRMGALLVRERWASVHGAPAAGAVVAPHVEEFEEDGAPPAARELPAGVIVANTRCAIAPVGALRDADVWMCDGRVAAVRLSRSVKPSMLAEGRVPLEELAPDDGRVATIVGRWVDEVWHLVTDLLAQLRDDITALGPSLSCETPSHATVIGDQGVFVERGAVVEPHVVLDVSAGPVLIRRDAVVRAFTRIVGPCAIASRATILGDRIHGCSIGEGSVVHGEISETVVLGQANKAHDGFVGHSYLGRWVNLGAGTITSNLKNTYGSVTLWTPEGARDTGVQKLGTFFGDHVKTGIGLRITTGTVLGAGSNVFGADMPPKHVRPFSWGEGSSLGTYRLDKFLDVTRRAMSRRQVTLGERGCRQLTRAFERAQQEME